MAPEIYKLYQGQGFNARLNIHEIDYSKSDVFSLGLVFLQMKNFSSVDGLNTDPNQIQLKTKIQEIKE